MNWKEMHSSVVTPKRVNPGMHRQSAFVKDLLGGKARFQEIPGDLGPQKLLGGAGV